MSLFPCLPEEEGSDYDEHESRYAFDIIGRQEHAGGINRGQYGIAKQDGSEQQDKYPKYRVLGFHDQLLCAILPYNTYPHGLFRFQCLHRNARWPAKFNAILFLGVGGIQLPHGEHIRRQPRTHKIQG